MSFPWALENITPVLRMITEVLHALEGINKANLEQEILHKKQGATNNGVGGFGCSTRDRGEQEV